MDHSRIQTFWSEYQMGRALVMTGAEVAYRKKNGMIDSVKSLASIKKTAINTDIIPSNDILDETRTKLS